MRRVTKGAIPVILAKNEQAWTAAYVAAAKIGIQRSFERWREPEIKAALNEETSRKCIYCDAVMGHVSYPHVEHIKPKSEFPELAHIWHNLGWACQVCNVNKREYYNANNPLLNPYVDDPAEHLAFDNEFVSPVASSSRGQATITELELNRIELAAARVKRVKSIERLVILWTKTEDDEIRESLTEAIKLDVDGEFSATVKAFLTAIGFPL